MKSHRENRGERSQGIFHSGNLALDLINTEMMSRKKRIELLSNQQQLINWWQDALERHPESHLPEQSIDFDEQLLASVKTLRQSLRSLCEHLVHDQGAEESDLMQLNRILSDGYERLMPGDHGKVHTVYQTRDPQGALLYPIARAMHQLLTEGNLERLHKCKNERCILYFYDTTKSGTRVYCSLDCLNRTRSIEHYRANKAQKQADMEHFSKII